MINCDREKKHARKNALDFSDGDLEYECFETTLLLFLLGREYFFFSIRSEQMDIEKLIVRVFISTYLALERAVETAQYFETEAHALFREVQPAHGAARVTAPTSEAYPCLLDRGKYVAVVVVIVVVALPIFLDAIFTVGLSMTGQGNVFVWGNDQTTRLLLTRSSEASPCTKCFSCFFALVYYIQTSYI